MPVQSARLNDLFSFVFWQFKAPDEPLKKDQEEY